MLVAMQLSRQVYLNRQQGSRPRSEGRPKSLEPLRTTTVGRSVSHTWQTAPCVRHPGKENGTQFLSWEGKGPSGPGVGCGFDATTHPVWLRNCCRGRLPSPRQPPLRGGDFLRAPTPLACAVWCREENVGCVVLSDAPSANLLRSWCVQKANEPYLKSKKLDLIFLEDL